MTELSPDLPGPDQAPRLRGEVRKLPARTALRLLEAVTLVLAVRGLFALVLRYVLSYRRHAELTAEQGVLQLQINTRLLGRSIRRAKHVFIIEQLGEFALQEQGEPPAFYAGLTALGLGTALGGWTLSTGLTVGAPSLLIGAALLFSAGVAADFLVGSGQRRAAWSGSPQLLVRGEQTGFVLSHLPLEQARSFFVSVQAELRQASTRA